LNVTLHKPQGSLQFRHTCSVKLLDYAFKTANSFYFTFYLLYFLITDFKSLSVFLLLSATDNVHRA